MKVEMGEYPDEGGVRDIVVELSPEDTWSMDATLAEIIVPMLEQLRDTTHGYPSDFGTFEGWIEALNEMIWCFNHIRDRDWEDEFYTVVGDMVTEGNRLVSTGIDVDSEGLKAVELRIQTGVELFGKYYQHLWD